MPPMTQERSVKLRNALNAGESDVLKSEAEGVEADAAGVEREIVFQHIAEARPDLIAKLPEITMLKGYRARPFSRLKRVEIAASGSPSALVDFTNSTYQLKPVPYGETQQPTGEYLGLSEIELFVKSTLVKNTLEALIEQHGVRIHYHDGRPALEMPLADALGVKVVNPAAGTAASDDSVVTGPSSIIQPTQQLIRLSGRDRLIVPPGDSQTRIELFRYPEYSSAPTLTGETATLYMYVIWRGWRYANSKGDK